MRLLTPLTLKQGLPIMKTAKRPARSKPAMNGPEDGQPIVVPMADQTAFEAATALIAHFISLARQTEAGIVADRNLEFLHEYRVALRKIRSVLSLFRGTYESARTANLKARFAAIVAATGPVRDLDVYLLEKPTFYALVPKPLHPGLDAMFATLAQDRQAAWVKLVRYLGSRAYLQDMTDLGAVFADRALLARGPQADLAADDFATTLIWKRYRKMRKIACAIGPNSDASAVHALRIQGKKLRYLIEFFAPLFAAAKVKPLLKPLKALQDHLGKVNDCAVQQVTLQRFLTEAGTAPQGANLALAQSVAALSGALHQRQHKERAKTVKVIARFSKTSTQDAFRDLFHPRKKTF